MKNQYLHTGNTTKKSSARESLFRAFGVIAGVTLAGAALAAGPEHSNTRSSKSQIVAENPDASSVHSQAKSSKNPIAEKYNTLVMRVYFGDRAERDRLAHELMPEEVPTTGGYLTVIRDRDLYYGLTARGLRVEIDEKSSRNLSDPQIMLDTFYSGYKTVEEIYAFLDQKVAQFPDLVEKVDIGDSWCKSNPDSCVLPAPWAGYDLFVLHLTNRNIAGPKPVLWADGDIHAREIATPEVVMRMVDHLLNNYDSNADVHWLLDYHDIWLMPVVNPDGHHIVESGGGGNSPYMYRKNGNTGAIGRQSGSSVDGGCAWPPTSSNHSGVDNNRNFPFHWGCCNGSSSFSCDQTYRGMSAGSEPEDMAIVDKLRTLVPDQRGPGDTDPAPITATGVYQNIHTVVPVNLFTWGWSSTQMPNYAETRNIAAHMAAPNAGGNGYPSGSIIEMLYPVDGGSIDWAYGELGMAAFSTELSGQDFLPSFSCIDNPGCGSTQGIWPENRGMLLYLAKIARTPYLTSHGPDANIVVANPALVPPGVPAHLTATINFAWTSNAFSQNVGAAEYYIDTPPWAGGTAIPMTGTFTSPTVAAEATIDTTSLSLGRHIIFVRGRGVNNFQGLETWGPISATFLNVTGDPTPTPSPSATPSPTGTPTPAPTPTPSPTPTATATPTTTPTATPTASPTPTAVPATLANISTRLRVETGNNVLIAGFIITGTESANVLLRGIGPSLGLPDQLANPTLELRDSSGTLLEQNDNWQTASNAQAITDTTIAPSNNLESAILRSLAPGSYTAILGGENGGTGIGLVEAYDLTHSAGVRLANISTRGLVQTGNNVLIAGTIVSGQGSQRVLLRAIGPSLQISGALADPALELRDGNGAILMSNDSWRSAQETEITATGIPPENDLEAAIIATLPANGASYTAIVSGSGGTTGIAVVEMYGLQ